ncbi:MAG: hypothetical protein KAW67_05830 [Candidatus Eisenbacteria sp.]|nr:hypothetical protein [Candidatus Eisenbacteria bacterium]
MIPRWVAWLVVLVALTTMATLRLADRKERIARRLPTARFHTPSPSGASSDVTEEGS